MPKRSNAQAKSMEVLPPVMRSHRLKNKLSILKIPDKGISKGNPLNENISDKIITEEMASNQATK